MIVYMEKQKNSMESPLEVINSVKPYNMKPTHKNK
jgi:hypothetical protein